MADSEHNITINLNGNASGAVSAFGRVKTALLDVRKAVSGVMSALGVFGMAWNGITVVFEWLNRIKSKLDEIRTAAARARFASEMASAAAETARLVGFHERLAALMKDEADTLAKQKTLRDQQQQIADDNEDGRRAADRARQIYEAQTPEEEQRLRDRFAADDERIAAKRKERDRKNRIKDLDEEDSSYTAQANALRGNNAEIGKMIAAREFDRKRAVTDEDRSTIDKELEGLRKRQEANDQAIAQYEREAKFRRDQIAILEGAGTGDVPTAGYWNRKSEQKKRAQEAKKASQSEAAAKAVHEEKIEKAKIDAWYDREYKDASTPNKYWILQGRENTARDTFEKLEKQIAEELAKATPDRDKLADLRSRSESAHGEMLRYRAQQEDLDRAARGRAESALERSYAVGQVSQNRLTSLGLGSGVSGSDTVGTEMRNVIALLEKQLAATKANKPAPTGAAAATYTE